MKTGTKFSTASNPCDYVITLVTATSVFYRRAAAIFGKRYQVDKALAESCFRERFWIAS